jgi:hypothetical protein
MSKGNCDMTIKCFQKQKTIIVKCWVERNDDWSLVSSVDTKKIKDPGNNEESV